jgi:hypothetical protein
MGLHPQLERLAFLLGTWEGRGRGDYPTIEGFNYEESISFTHDGRPFLVYEQRTRHPDHGTPMHRETGFLRIAPDGKLEFLVTGTTGHIEISTGTVDGYTIDLRSTELRGAPTAKDVHTIERHLEVDGDRLRYTLSLEAGGQPLQEHLEAELHRAG